MCIDVALNIRRDIGDDLGVGHGGDGFDLPHEAHEGETHELRPDQAGTSRPLCLTELGQARAHKCAVDDGPKFCFGAFVVSRDQ